MFTVMVEINFNECKGMKENREALVQKYVTLLKRINISIIHSVGLFTFFSLKVVIFFHLGEHGTKT